MPSFLSCAICYASVVLQVGERDGRWKHFSKSALSLLHCEEPSAAAAVAAWLGAQAAGGSRWEEAFG